MTLTITEFAAMGGKARWKGTTKEERRKKMSELAHLSWEKRKGATEGAGTPKLQHKKVIQQTISENT